VLFYIVSWIPQLLHLRRPDGIGLNALIAPAQDAVEYQVRTFHSNFHGDTSPYQGPPSDAVDNLWEDLFGSKNASGRSRSPC
jgi:hypothetical protein